MSERVALLQERLSEAETLDAVGETVLGIRDVFDVEHVVFHATGAEDAQFSVTSYDDDWARTYQEQGFQKIDPVVRGCLGGFAPLDWKRLDWSSKQARMVMKEGMANGVGNQGFSVPIRGPSGQFAVFSVNDRANDDQWASFSKGARNEMLLVAHHLNERVLTLTEPEAHAPHQNLSPRETDALTNLARGRSRAQAAERLKISEHTLRVYIESARFKLGASNTTHAVATAMARGLVSL